MRGVLGALWVLFIIISSGCYGIEILGSSGRTKQALPSPSLPQGYFILPGDNVAYKIFENKTTWSEARNQCISDGGNLAIADTPEKINHIKEMNSGSHKPLFVGFRRPIRPNVWIRVDNGSPVPRLPWKELPKIDSGFDCAAITTNNQLIDVSCGWVVSSICEIHLSQDTVFTSNRSTSQAELAATTTQGLTQPGIPAGYKIFPGDKVAYKKFKSWDTFDRARARCILDGADLAISDTIDKIVHIKRLFPGPVSWLVDGFLVGFYRPAISNGWIRIDNDSKVPTMSLPWRQVPEVNSGYDCAAIAPSASYLMDHICSRKISSVCEIKIGNDISYEMK